MRTSRAHRSVPVDLHAAAERGRESSLPGCRGLAVRAHERQGRVGRRARPPKKVRPHRRVPVPKLYARCVVVPISSESTSTVLVPMPRAWSAGVDDELELEVPVQNMPSVSPTTSSRPDRPGCRCCRRTPSRGWTRSRRPRTSSHAAAAFETDGLEPVATGRFGGAGVDGSKFAVAWLPTRRPRHERRPELVAWPWTDTSPAAGDQPVLAAVVRGHREGRVVAVCRALTLAAATGIEFPATTVPCTLPVACACIRAPTSTHIATARVPVSRPPACS